MPPRVIRTPPRLLSAEMAAAARRKNLNDAFRDLDETSSGMADAPSDLDKVRRLAGQKGAEGVEDAQSYGGLPPRQIIADSIKDLGTPLAGRVAARSMWEGLTADPTYTNKFSNSFTGGAPTVVAPFPVTTNLEGISPMGAGNRVAVTKITPMRMLENMVGGEDRAIEIASRLGERNLPGGAGGAAVYHLEDLNQSLLQPWLLFRDMKNGFADARTKGFAHPLTKTMWMNPASDPDIHGRGGFNIATHEATHGILDGILPSRGFSALQLSRPAVSDIKHKIPETSQASYFQPDGYELGNLLFQTKRQTEASDPRWRDIGATRESADEWLESVRGFQPTGSDPVIDLPGHRNFGQPVHGYEEGMQMLKEVLEALKPEGLEDAKNINFKTGAKSSLKEALLT